MSESRHKTYNCFSRTQSAIYTMMSAPEESTSVLDLELIAQEELKKRKREKAAKPMQQSAQEPAPSVIIEDNAVIEDKLEPPVELPPEAPVVPAAPTKLVRKRKAARKKKQLPVGTATSRQIAKKHDAERRMLQKNLNEMAKKRERDIKDLMDEVLKEHYSQVDKERLDYLSILGELKDTIALQSKEVTNNCQQVVTTAAQDEVERMVNWFHDEFMKELDKKTNEYEGLKANAEKQVNKMTEESDSKSQRIMMMDEKIKQLATHLPEDLRRELFEELGLQHLEPEPKPEAKRERRGVFYKLSQLFKRAPKKSKPAPNKKKQKSNQKRVVAKQVIAS